MSTTEMVWSESVEGRLLHSFLRINTLEKAGKAQESREDDKTQGVSGKSCQDPRLSCILNTCRKCRRIAHEAWYSPCISYLVLWKAFIPIGSLGIRSVFSLWSLSFILRTGIFKSQNRTKLPIIQFVLMPKNTCLYFFLSTNSDL